MTFIPHFVQNELEAGDGDTRISTFNWCNPFDTVLPIADGTTDAGDRAQLWGLYTGIAVDPPVAALDDTRLSVWNFCNPFDHAMPAADGSIDASNRQHLMGLYAGILADPPVASSPVKKVRRFISNTGRMGLR